MKNCNKTRLTDKIKQRSRRDTIGFDCGAAIRCLHLAWGEKLSVSRQFFWFGEAVTYSPRLRHMHSNICNSPKSISIFTFIIEEILNLSRKAQKTIKVGVN